jgi:carboxyl-terminal processing protease
MAAVLAGVTAGVALGVALDRWVLARQQGPLTTAGVFQDVLSAIRSSFVDSLTDDELYVKAARGVVSTLGDPYSAFLPPDEFRRYREILTGTGASLGFTVAGGITGTRVTAVFAGSAADRAGVLPGQFLVEVNDEPTVGVALDRIRGLLRPDTGAVTLAFRSPGDSVPVVVDLRPAATRFPPVTAAVLLEERIGYVAVRSLSDQSTRAVREAISRLDPGGLDGLILDLRGNLGGRLDEALNLAELFLDPGQRIGSVAKRAEFPALYQARTAQPWPHLRLVLLVDRQTASSAEIVAAALRDHGRAVLVGDRTFGKGLIQTTIPLGDSIAVRLSTGRWQRPGGTTLEAGVGPDSLIEVPAARRRLEAGLALHAPLVARELESIASGLLSVQSNDSLRLSDKDIVQLAAALKQAGSSIGQESLTAHRTLLDHEVRRIVSLLAGRAKEAERAALMADPAVQTGLASLRPRTEPVPPTGP